MGITKHWLGKPTVLLAAVLLLAVALRLTGITWGIPTRSMPFFLHPDETRVMDALSSLDIAKGQLTPRGGHMDGMLGYYAWIGVIGAAKALGVLEAYPYKTTLGDEQYFKTILVGRLLVALFDLASIAVVYLILLRLDVAPSFAALGALALSVFPIEVIYAHYMRPHVISNFFVSIVMLVSLRMQQSLKARWRILCGIFCGMATATMYPGILTLVLPISIVWYEDVFLKHKLSLSFSDFIYVFISRSIFEILFGFAIGFFACDPMLLLDFRNALAPLATQWKEAANFGQMGGGLSLQFRKLSSYISELIPRGTGPFLWVLLYASFLAAPFWPRRRVYMASLATFVVAVVYGMGIAYFHRAEFVRTMIMIFPPLAVLFGWTAAMAWERCTSRRWRLGLALILFFCLGTTLLFDGAYLRAMTLPDSRDSLLSYFREMPGGASRHIGVVTTNWMSEFLANPLRSLENEGNATITPIYPDTPREALPGQDFLCFVDFTDLGRDDMHKKIDALTSGGGFLLDRVIQHRLCFLGLCFDAERLPHDMAYPFPRYLLLRHVGNVETAP